MGSRVTGLKRQDGWDSSSYFPTLTASSTAAGQMTVTLPDYAMWYEEMRKELKELEQTNETILKLLAEVLDK